MKNYYCLCNTCILVYLYGLPLRLLHCTPRALSSPVTNKQTTELLNNFTVFNGIEKQLNNNDWKQPSFN